MKKLIFLFAAFLFTSSLFAKPEQEIIIQLKAQYELAQFQKTVPELVFQKTLINRLQVHLFTLSDTQKIDFTILSQHPMVRNLIQNQIIESRNREPNDPRYGEQWALDKIGMPRVWDITTGGTTANGDKIVVAIIDTDFSTEHQDLEKNIWINNNETPNNNVDDDGNGYVDDINGWNFGGNNNEFDAGVHGTSVSGIIGASGNDGVGVSGINWEIDLMYLKYERNVSEIFEAYEYVTELRRRYNESKGAEGALIVAVNSSFGLSNPEICASSNIWNQAHDMMGAVGILIAAAADNDPINSDVVGDIPSSCPSDYIIATVSTDETDDRWQGSAIGETTLDIAAPGIDILTTQGDTGYRNFDANSSATPHIAGAIAILYSLPSEELANMTYNEPVEAAKLVRASILESVDPLVGLEGLVSTGGRLNVFNAVKQLELYLNPGSNLSDEFGVTQLAPNPVNTNLEVYYETPDESVFTMRIYDAIGRLIEERSVDPCCFKELSESFDLSNAMSGIYFLQIERLGESSIQSFVVEQ